MKLTKPYQLLFRELEKNIYCTYNVYDYIIKEDMPPEDKKNVIMKVDVDLGLHLSLELAFILKEKNINASFYFLTFPNRYYNIWKSDIPKIISNMGFEVGLHTDHYYEQIISGKDAIEGIKEDVKRLSNLIGKPIHGMVYHGHKEIDALGRTNWEIYKYSKPEDLGLFYHDGYNTPYTNNRTDYSLSDFMSVAGAWRYSPHYPIKTLRRMKAGESILIEIHPHNAFEYWKNWDYSYDEKMPERESSIIESLINFWKVKYMEVKYDHPKIYSLLKEVKRWRKDLSYLSK